MNQMLKNISVVLLVDAGIYLLQELLGPGVTSRGLVSVFFEILGFGIVMVVGFVVARSTQSLSRSFLATLAFWFVWRPLLFVLVGLPISILLRGLSVDQALKATMGLGIALVLFSPVALALGGFGGWFGRRAHSLSNKSS